MDLELARRGVGEVGKVTVAPCGERMFHVDYWGRTKHGIKSMPPVYRRCTPRRSK